jgi:hypothetical protein
MRRKGGSKGGKSYTVGYGKPPVHTRFAKGVSGNPRGKKKGQKSLRAILQEVFGEKISVRTSRGVRKVTKLRALVEKTMNDALTGNPRAVLHMVTFAKHAGLTQEAEVIEAATGELKEEDLAILKRYMKPERQR